MTFQALPGFNVDLITKSCVASQRAYETNEHYIKEETGEVVIFAFPPSFSAKDWLTPENKSPFGEIKMKRAQFPCMRSIGKDDDATANEAFLKNLEVLIDSRTYFYASVSKYNLLTLSLNRKPYEKFVSET